MEYENSEDLFVYRIFRSQNICEETDTSKPIAIFKGKKDAIDVGIYLGECGFIVLIDRFAISDNEPYFLTWQMQFQEDEKVEIIL